MWECEWIDHSQTGRTAMLILLSVAVYCGGCRSLPEVPAKSSIRATNGGSLKFVGFAYEEIRSCYLMNTELLMDIHEKRYLKGVPRSSKMWVIADKYKGDAVIVAVRSRAANDETVDQRIVKMGWRKWIRGRISCRPVAAYSGEKLSDEIKHSLEESENVILLYGGGDDTDSVTFIVKAPESR